MAFLCSVSLQKPHKPVPRKGQKQNAVGNTCVMCYCKVDFGVRTLLFGTGGVSPPRAVTQPAEGWWSECTLTQSQHPLG